MEPVSGPGKKPAVTRPLFAIAAFSLLSPGFSQPAPTLEVRLVVACNAPGASEPMRLKGTSRTLCLAPSVWTNQYGIDSARVERDLQGKPMILLTLNRQAAAREQVLTGQNIGRDVGIVLNGELVSAPTIKRYYDQIPIQADFTPAEGDAIAASFNRSARKR
jgi:preprotein translocase subunit SecD